MQVPDFSPTFRTPKFPFRPLLTVERYNTHFIIAGGKTGRKLALSVDRAKEREEPKNIKIGVFVSS